MTLVSVIIPSRNEIFTAQTVADLLAKARADLEIIVVLDGWWPDPPLSAHPGIGDDKRLIQLHRGTALGMRAAINGAAGIAKGDFLMKCDAHCMFAEGYDLALAADCDRDWIVIPRRYSLDAENWKIDNNGKPPRDYHYLCYPAWDKEHDAGMHGVEWWGRGKERSAPQYDIDDNMSAQGSCWFMPREYFNRSIGPLSEVGYGTFAQEFQQIGLTCWLGGGQVKVNKKVWYAHLHKGKTYGRMWHMDRQTDQSVRDAHGWAAKYWMTNAWEKRVHDLEWLIEKFSPVPTWENWPEKFRAWREHYGV